LVFGNTSISITWAEQGWYYVGTYTYTVDDSKDRIEGIISGIVTSDTDTESFTYQYYFYDGDLYFLETRGQLLQGQYIKQK
jgi:hypothetical protein